MSASFSAVSSTEPTPPAPGPGAVDAAAIAQTTGVLSLTSLNAGGTAPSRIANLGYANVTSSVNRSAQNAVANQQSHSQLNLSVLGRSINQVSQLGPKQARASMDVFSDNAMAETLAGLQAAVDGLTPGGEGFRPNVPPGWRALAKLISEILAEVVAIELQNERLRGTGTADDPYHTVPGQDLYVKAPVSLLFVDVTPQQLRLDQDIHGRRG